MVNPFYEMVTNCDFGMILYWMKNVKITSPIANIFVTS